MSFIIEIVLGILQGLLLSFPFRQKNVVQTAELEKTNEDSRNRTPDLARDR